MDTPNDIGALLHGILREESTATKTGVHVDDVKVLEGDDLAFVERVLRSIGGGSVGIFIGNHPRPDEPDQLQYIVMGSNAARAIPIMVTVLKRLVDRAEDEA